MRHNKGFRTDQVRLKIDSIGSYDPFCSGFIQGISCVRIND